MNTDQGADTSDQLLVDATPLAKLEETEQIASTCQKRECEEEEDDDDDREVQKRRAVTKQSRRHNWQPKYAMEFGLLAIERDAVSGDAVSGDVLLAMCGFCKAFGREGKYDQLVRQDQEAGNDSKKRRRRSLTTTKFFRAFRVDNIRSHLQGAHPRRWAEYEVLPKQETIRARYLQLQGELQTYDHIPMVDDVVLGGSALNAEDMTYTQTHPIIQSSVSSEAQHAVAQAAAQVAVARTAQTSTGMNGVSHGTAQTTTSLNYNASSAASSAASASTAASPSTPALTSFARGTFDYEKHLTEQIALDRERLEFEKIRFRKEVELRERELALREKHMEQKMTLHKKLCDANRESAQLESVKFYRLAEVLRDVISGAQSSSETASVV